jgi:hypothetical protein
VSVIRQEVDEQPALGNRPPAGHQRNRTHTKIQSLHTKVIKGWSAITTAPAIAKNQVAAHPFIHPLISATVADVVKCVGLQLSFQLMKRSHNGLLFLLRGNHLELECGKGMQPAPAATTYLWQKARKRPTSLPCCRVSSMKALQRWRLSFFIALLPLVIGVHGHRRRRPSHFLLLHLHALHCHPHCLVLLKLAGL